MLVDCVLKMVNAGAFSSLPANVAFEGDLETFGPLYDLFYWSKYLELIDTFVLVVKQKPLDFLHVFHHSTTGTLGFVSRFQPLCLGVYTNTFIHIGMYLHFARPVRALRPIITTLQIVQFLWVLSVYNIWIVFYSSLTLQDVAFQNGCYFVYLAFFCQFFYRNYISPQPRSHKKKE